MIAVIKQICIANSIDFKQAAPISGGDISDAFALTTTSAKQFLKINEAGKYPGMFLKEAEGLTALQQATSLIVPKVIAVGEVQGFQYLLLSWLNEGKQSVTFWQDFAEGLAELHMHTNENFGWHNLNYIGSLPQLNQLHNHWSDFYQDQRLMPLVKQLKDKQYFSNTDVDVAYAVCNKLSTIFPNETPALLHGDLWAGNFMVVEDGVSATAAIFDPAVYYGHREMDIGMSLLFGGFDKVFYNHYNECFKLEKDWEQRVTLTQLYPLLVHAVLFGGSYISRCRTILNFWK